MRQTVIRRMEFSFSHTASGTMTASFPLATCIDSSRCVSGSMYLRLHAKDWTSSETGSFNVFAKNVSYTPDEPNVAYLSAAATPVATIGVGPSDDPGTLFVQPLATPIGDQLQIQLEWSHGADTTTKTFAISVEPELREA